MNNWIIKVFFSEDFEIVWHSVYCRDEYIDSFFDYNDAVSFVLYNSRTNPDGRMVGATDSVPHG